MKFTTIIFLLLISLTAFAQPNVSLQVQNRQYLPGDTINVQFDVYGFTDIAAYQLAVQFRLGALEFLAIDSAASDFGLTFDNFGTQKLSQGLLPTNFSDVSGHSLPDGSCLFAIVFIASDTGSLVSDLWLQHDPVMSPLGNPFLVKPLAYTPSLMSGPITLSFYDISTGVVSPVSATNAQAIPNPCPRHTTIAFDAIGVADYRILVTDMAGRMVRSTSGVTSPGNNEIPITFPDAGMYFVRVSTPCGSFIEKVIAE